MAYSSHRHHSAQKVSHHRVKHILASGGCAKAGGGAVGQAEHKAEHELRAMHGKKDLHEAMKSGGIARGNDSESMTTEGEKPRRRARGGGLKIKNLNVVHVHRPGMGGMGPGTMGGLPIPPAGGIVGGPPSSLELPTAGMLRGQPPPMRVAGRQDQSRQRDRRQQA
jgi:hypothetical protein